MTTHIKTGEQAAPQKSARRRAREFALQGVYQHLMSGNGAVDIISNVEVVPGFDKADRKLYVTLLRGALENPPGLEAEFAPFIDRPAYELSPIERAILVLATFELRTFPETPYRVIINEAIELAKEFGGTDGHRFVNGVLDKLAPVMRADEVEANRIRQQQKRQGNAPRSE